MRGRDSTSFQVFLTARTQKPEKGERERDRDRERDREMKKGKAGETEKQPRRPFSKIIRTRVGSLDLERKREEVRKMPLF